MFVRRKEIKLMHDRVERLERSYWELWGAHERLLIRLGIDDVKPPPLTALRARPAREKGG